MFTSVKQTLSQFCEKLESQRHGEANVQCNIPCNGYCCRNTVTGSIGEFYFPGRNASGNFATNSQALCNATFSCKLRRLAAAANENVPLTSCDHRKQGKLVARNAKRPSNNLFRRVRTFAATKLQDKLQQKLATVTAPLIKEKSTTCKNSRNQFNTSLR